MYARLLLFDDDSRRIALRGDINTTFLVLHVVDWLYIAKASPRIIV